MVTCVNVQSCALRVPRLFYSVAVVLVLILPGLSSAADDFEAGRQAFEAQDYARTLELWQPLAQTGHAKAQFGMATLYHEGSGVAQSFEESARWFRASAENGFAPAQFNLGNSYKHGRGIERDESQANHWWRLAGEQEFAPAQYNLATQYYFGRGVEKNEQTALIWYRRAADNGHERALKLFEHAPESSESVSEQSAEPALPSEAEAPAQPAETAVAASQVAVASADSMPFTLQLLATRDAAAAQKSASRADLNGQASVYNFDRDGARWHGVIYGAFVSREAAEAAVPSLPADLRKSKPWIRRLADIRALAIAGQ